MQGNVNDKQDVFLEIASKVFNCLTLTLMDSNAV